MSSLLILTTVLSTQIPEAAVDRTWGDLMRATHYTGTWHVVADDKGFTGDWVVVDAKVSSTRFGTRRWVHFLSTRSNSSYCAVAVDEPGRMRCESAAGKIDDLWIDKAIPTTQLVSIESDVDRLVCTNGSCTSVRAGAMHTTLRPATPTISKGETLFWLIHGTSLAAALGAKHIESRGLSLRMPYRIVTAPTDAYSLKSYSQEVIVVEATISFGTSPKPKIAPHEVERFVEDCTNPHAGMLSSCTPSFPICKRRGR